MLQDTGIIYKNRCILHPLHKGSNECYLYLLENSFLGRAENG